MRHFLILQAQAMPRQIEGRLDLHHCMSTHRQSYEPPLSCFSCGQMLDDDFKCRRCMKKKSFFGGSKNFLDIRKKKGKK